MYTFISMLRGINVSGHKPVRMAELKGMYQSLGFADVVTYVQSGNVVFDCPQTDPSHLADGIEGEITRLFGYAVKVFIRSPYRFQQIIEGNPFTTLRNEDPTKLYVTFLYKMPPALAYGNLSLPVHIDDEFIVSEQEIYLFCPDGYGRTKLSNDFFERKLGTPATTRNWKTVQALFEIAARR